MEHTKERHVRAIAAATEVVRGTNWGSGQRTWEFKGQWMSRWHYYWQSETLVNAYKNARPSDWPPQGEGQLFGALKIYGYTNMLFNEYNQMNDWRRP